MFWKKSPNPNPYGVRLTDVAEILSSTTIKTRIEGNTLVAQNETSLTRIEVVIPEVAQTADGLIQAVIRIRSEIPDLFRRILRDPGTAASMNSFASLSCVYADPIGPAIGSRLTVYEGENAWQSLQLPLVAFSVILGAEAILGGIRRSIGGAPVEEGESAWSGVDFRQAEGYLSKICVCNSDEVGLTAEFGLHGEGRVSAVTGNMDTALFQMKSNASHPALGGGLFCLLQLPHQFADKASLLKICAMLNSTEMESVDSPPHFGGWCAGRLGNNPAYVTFIPNALSSVSGIATNVAFWAASRAAWANGILDSEADLD